MKVNMFAGRPVIGIVPELSDPVIGFAQNWCDDSCTKIRVKDYISMNDVDVDESHLMVYTQQRYAAIFEMKRVDLISILYMKAREIQIDASGQNQGSYNELKINAALCQNAFHDKYATYLQGR